MVFQFMTGTALQLESVERARERKLINDQQHLAILSEKQLRNQNYQQHVWGQWQRIITVFVLGATLLGGPLGYWFGQQSRGAFQGVAERRI